MIYGAIDWLFTPGFDQKTIILIAGLLALFAALEIRAHYACRRGK
jgi:hypothetical protein